MLADGVHEATLDEVELSFGRFQKSDRRPKLFRKLLDYLKAVKRAECGTAALINGSFAMACIDEPEDVDLVLVLPPGWDAGAELKPYQYNLLSRRRVRKEFGLDVVAVREGSNEEQQWTSFFRQVNVRWCEAFEWPDDTKKGIIKVLL